MLTLFFGNPLAIISTVFLLAVLGIIIYTAAKHKKIKKWGRRTFALAVTGLILCCLVATRDGLVDTMQGGTGLFSLTSVQIGLASIGGLVIAYSAFSSIFVRNQKYRKVMFFVLSFAILFKAALIEASRIVMS